MSPGRSPMAFLPVPSQEPEDIRVQNPVEFSAELVVSYSSGRPRSWPYSCA